MYRQKLELGRYYAITNFSLPSSDFKQNKNNQFILITTTYDF